MPQSATWDHVFWQLARAVLTWSVCPLLLLLMTREWSTRLWVTCQMSYWRISLSGCLSSMLSGFSVSTKSGGLPFSPTSFKRWMQLFLHRGLEYSESGLPADLEVRMLQKSSRFVSMMCLQMSGARSRLNQLLWTWRQFCKWIQALSVGRVSIRFIIISSAHAILWWGFGMNSHPCCKDQNSPHWRRWWAIQAQACTSCKCEPLAVLASKLVAGVYMNLWRFLILAPIPGALAIQILLKYQKFRAVACKCGIPNKSEYR